MTSWEQHHPPHDHPDFETYLESLTEDDLAALNAANDTALNAADGERGSDQTF